MTAFLVVLHILVSLFLILFVLLQPGARGGVGAAFGGAGGQTVFGGRGANTFLARLTAAAAVIFMFTSITLSFFGSSSSSVMASRAKAAARATTQKDDADAKKDDGKKDDAKADAAGSTGDAAGADDGEINESGSGKPVGDAPPAP